jgi:NAD(P)-dependent dehydrogenase (short-subunit alcohol dehydrogenase family)
MQIAERTFLVTGGASGLGEACVRRLVGLGGRVVIADVNEAAGEELARDLGGSAVFVTTDVTSSESGQRAVETARTHHGGLHGLINCAGVLGASRILTREGPHPLELFSRVIQINLVGTFNMLRLAAEAMEQNSPDASGERGVIVNTSSVSAFEGQIGQTAYAASKGGVASLTLPAARELARIGVRVVAIAPGVFGTPMMQAAPDAVRDSLAAQIPFPPRLGKPEEFAHLIQHAIENVMLNGCVLRLDGGLRMGPK